MIVMPMPAGRRNQRRDAIGQFQRREGERRLPIRTRLGEGVAEALIVPRLAPRFEPLAGERGPGAVAQQALQGRTILGLDPRSGAPHVAVYDGSLVEWSADRTLPMETG